VKKINMRFSEFVKMSLNEGKGNFNEFEVYDKFITVDGQIGFFDKFVSPTEARVIYIKNGNIDKVTSKDLITTKDIEFDKTIKINKDIRYLNNTLNKMDIHKFDMKLVDYKNGKIYFHISISTKSISKDEMEQVFKDVSSSSIFNNSNFDSYKKNSDEMVFLFSAKV